MTITDLQAKASSMEETIVLREQEIKDANALDAFSAIPNKLREIAVALSRYTVSVKGKR
jgi:hypothetical protein